MKISFKVIESRFRTMSINDEEIPYNMNLNGMKFSTASDVVKMFSWMQNETKEHFVAIHLNNKHEILCIDFVSSGSLTASIVHPREVFKNVLLSSAAAIILVHNHPSGDPTPSREDLDLTSRLRQGAELLGIRILDHIIIGTSGHVSLADRGLLG